MRTTPLLAFALLAFPACAGAQNFNIDWFTIDCGGGTSTGGVYSVSGTIGQPDAGARMTNGNYSLTGGFWSLPAAIQTPGAPTLFITRAPAPGMVTISWAPNTPGFVLQSADSLSLAAWTNTPSGAANPVIVPASEAKRFYRLRQ
jgi:hypothetical protein